MILLYILQAYLDLVTKLEIKHKLKSCQMEFYSRISDKFPDCCFYDKFRYVINFCYLKINPSLLDYNFDKVYIIHEIFEFIKIWKIRCF